MLDIQIIDASHIAYMNMSGWEFKSYDSLKKAFSEIIEILLKILVHNHSLWIVT